MNETKTAEVEITKPVYAKLRKKMSNHKKDCTCSTCK